MKTSSNKLLFLTFILLLICGYVVAQEDYTLFYNQSIMTSNTGMSVLGGWAIGNIALGAYGWIQGTGQQKYFNQMNLFWNTVNLTIAGVALYNNYHTDISLLNAEQIMSKHLQTEKILLINSALDAGYIGTGFLLRYLSGKSEQRSDLLKGYGNSLLLQGGFLLVFDVCLYGIMRNQRLDFLDNLNLSISTDLTGFQVLIYL
jgi:hypothetical protein